MPAALSTLTAVTKAYKATKMFFDKYPVSRGMSTFAVMWTSGNLIQQSIDDNREEYDFIEAFRYGMYGSCINAPLIYNWIRTLTTLIPGNTLKLAIAKGYVDQLVFAPLNLTQFFIGMSLLEGKKLNDAVEECMDKMLPTWMISISIWPIFQTINFTCIPEKNRVMFISFGSFLWMIFLSYIHHTETDNLPENLKMRRRVHYDYDYGALTEALQEALMEGTPGEDYYPAQMLHDALSGRRDYSIGTSKIDHEITSLDETKKDEDIPIKSKLCDQLTLDICINETSSVCQQDKTSSCVTENFFTCIQTKMPRCVNEIPDKYVQDMFNAVSKLESLNHDDYYNNNGDNGIYNNNNNNYNTDIDNNNDINNDNNNNIYSQDKLAGTLEKIDQTRLKSEQKEKKIIENKSDKIHTSNIEEALYSCMRESECVQDSSITCVHGKIYACIRDKMLEN